MKSTKQGLQQKSVWAFHPEGFCLYLSQTRVIEVKTTFQLPSIEWEVHKVFNRSDKEPQECMAINWFSLLTLYRSLLLEKVLETWSKLIAKERFLFVSQIAFSLVYI